eukprot:6116802-Prymnesium_polylepis.2
MYRAIRPPSRRVRASYFGSPTRNMHFHGTHDTTQDAGHWFRLLQNIVNSAQRPANPHSGSVHDPNVMPNRT